MLFMVIEHYDEGVAEQVYRRFAERGRLAPDDVRYVASWVDEGFRRCFQVMEAPDEDRLRAWTDQWDDLVAFEVVPVRTSAEAAAIMAGRREATGDAGGNAPGADVGGARADTRAGPDPVLTTVAAVPYLALLALYGFVLRARLDLGQWPAPYRPDPKDLGFDFHHAVVWLGLEVAALSPLALLLALVVRRWIRIRRGKPWWPVAVYSWGYGVLWALVSLDPGRFVEWYFD